MVYSKAKLRAVAIKYLLVSNHSEQKLHQIFTYAKFTAGFV